VQPVIDLLSQLGPWGVVAGVVLTIVVQRLGLKFPQLAAPTSPAPAPVVPATSPAALGQTTDNLLTALKGSVVSKAGTGADPAKTWNAWLTAQLATIHAPATAAPPSST
jgi:hypothetical protein